MAKSDRPSAVVLQLISSSEPRLTLDEIYRRYGRYVAAIILRLDGRATEVEDLVQDVFVEAAAGITRLREPEAIRGWLATIAVRTVRRRLRLRRVRQFFGLDRDIAEIGLAAHVVSPMDRLLLRAVYRVLDGMSVEDRLAFSLHTIEGETLDEVAKLCDCSLATAKRRVARAQGMIEQRLSDG